MKLSILILVVLICQVYADSNKDREFINIQNPIPCVRRFNTTHQIGCADKDIGNYEGVVYAVRNESELNRLYSINDLDDKKLVVVTMPQYFEAVVNFYLRNPVKSSINGIVLNAGSTASQNLKISPYSDDTPKPNKNFGLYSNKNYSDPKSWNAFGSSNMFQNFQIPIYVITDQEEAERSFRDCFDKFNQKIFNRANNQSKFQFYSTELLCGMQLGIEMSGAISSKICTRRSVIQHTLEPSYFCDPLGGSSYFSFLSQQPSNSLPITIISSRIDTFTLFEYYTPAANEPVSSIIGLLSLAELLSKHRADLTKRNLLFVLFDNEAFDYGGSSRFVNDLNLNKFPKINTNSSNDETFKLDKANITTMIELGQLGSMSLDETNNLYIHKDFASYFNLNETTKLEIDNLISNLKTTSNSTIIQKSDINQELPPSSLQTFLRLNLTLGGFLITDHEKTFKNPFYHSVFDTAENLNITFPENITEQEAANFTTNFSRRLQFAITSIAKSIYSFSSDNKELDDQANQITLNRLVYCFYKNSTCEYFKSILTTSQWQNYQTMLDSLLPKKKLSFYTSVNDAQISGKWITQMLLKYFTRNILFDSLNSTDCNKNSVAANKLITENSLRIASINFVNNSTCVATSVYAVSSVSPAFDKYDQGILVDTDRFSAWTESNWNGKTTQMRLFIFTTNSVNISTILIGVVTFLFSFVATYLVNKNSNKWFALNNSEQTDEIIEQ